MSMTSGKISRRELLRAGGVGAAAVALLPGLSAAGEAKPGTEAVRPSAPTPSTPAAKVAPKAVVFDTFGTVVDWRGSIIAEGAQWGKAKGIQIDWAKFTDGWRDQYRPALDKVIKGELPWMNVDTLNRIALENVLKEFKITGLTEEEKDDWNHVWHRLKPWPDTIPGLTRLKKKFTITTLSNGNFALLTNMGKHAGLPWDAIMSSELAKHYKPDHEVYLTGAALLGLKPEEVMMGAAHVYDLNAARDCGFKTGFIYRPTEYGPSQKADTAKQGDYDIVATSMVDLAAQLGA